MWLTKKAKRPAIAKQCQSTKKFQKADQSSDMFTKSMCWRKLRNITKGSDQNLELATFDFFMTTHADKFQVVRSVLEKEKVHFGRILPSYMYPTCFSVGSFFIQEEMMLQEMLWVLPFISKWIPLLKKPYEYNQSLHVYKSDEIMCLLLRELFWSNQ